MSEEIDAWDISLLSKNETVSHTNIWEIRQQRVTKAILCITKCMAHRVNSVYLVSNSSIFIALVNLFILVIYQIRVTVSLFPRNDVGNLIYLSLFSKFAMLLREITWERRTVWTYKIWNLIYFVEPYLQSWDPANLSNCIVPNHSSNRILHL